MVMNSYGTPSGMTPWGPCPQYPLGMPVHVQAVQGYQYYYVRITRMNLESAASEASPRDQDTVKETCFH